jgi:hypothetical protein
MQFQHHNITSDKWSDQNNEISSCETTVENRGPSKIGWRCDITIRSL